MPLAVLTSQSTSTFVPAMLDVTVGALVPVDLTTPHASASLTVSAIAASSGLFYSEACSDAGIYTDPSTGACTNASDPAFALCAFGSGAECRPCPFGAFCPGGFRAWPRPGLWSAAESSADVRRCVQPDATGKCLGWSAALGAAQCGAQYRQGSYLCSGGFVGCPDERTPWKLPPSLRPCSVRASTLSVRRRHLCRVPRLAVPVDPVLRPLHSRLCHRGLRAHDIHRNSDYCACVVSCRARRRQSKRQRSQYIPPCFVYVLLRTSQDVATLIIRLLTILQVRRSPSEQPVLWCVHPAFYL